MLRILLLLSSLFLFGFAKSLHIQWDKTYGADKEDKAYGVTGTMDGGIAMAGATRSFSLGKEDVYILKTDPKGTLLWEKRLGGPRKDIAYAIDENNKGALYVAGLSKSFSKEGDYNVYVLKLSPEGKVLWSKSMGGPGKDYGYDITATKDGGAVVVGKTKSFGHGHYDMYVIKLSSDGKILWSKAFGGTSNEEAHGVTELPDGSLIIVGGTESFGAEILTSMSSNWHQTAKNCGRDTTGRKKRISSTVSPRQQTAVLPLPDIPAPTDRKRKI